MVRSLGYAIVRSLRRVKPKVELRWTAPRVGLPIVTPMSTHARLASVVLFRAMRGLHYSTNTIRSQEDKRGGRHEVGCGRWCGIADAWIAELVPGTGQSL